MVEIDSLVVEACKEFIPQTSCSLDHEKLELIIGDGVKYAAETKEKFDVVLVDSTDPIGPAAPLFNVKFYDDIRNLLNDKGIVVSQCESPYYYLKEQKGLLKILKEVFETVSLYSYSNLTYPGSLWSFSFASKGLHPIKDFEKERVWNSSLDFKYYNAEIHQAAFAHPNFMRKELEGLLTF